MTFIRKTKNLNTLRDFGYQFKIQYNKNVYLIPINQNY